MNQSIASEIEMSAFDHVLYATRISLGIAWKIGVSAIAVALIMGMVAGPDAQSEKPSLSVQQPVRLEQSEENNSHYRVYTQLPAGKTMTHLELYDPTGKLHLTLAYDQNGLMYSFTPKTDPFQIGYSRRPGGHEAVSVRTSVAHFSVNYLKSGESGVVVTAPDGHRQDLGQIWVDPQGKTYSPFDDTQ